MTEDEILEERLNRLANREEYSGLIPIYLGLDVSTYFRLALNYINRLKDEMAGLTGAVEAKQTDCDNLTRTLEEMRERAELAETQLREILSALYKQTDNENKSFTIYQSDIVEIAQDYKITEEELK